MGSFERILGFGHGHSLHGSTEPGISVITGSPSGPTWVLTPS
jgi:hypothetical protein